MEDKSRKQDKKQNPIKIKFKDWVQNWVYFLFLVFNPFALILLVVSVCLHIFF